jgi:replicative superfamily II helicase
LPHANAQKTDRLVAEGAFDLLVGVYEKMKAYLVLRPELLSQIGLIIVDEIQTLGEKGRGESLDLLLGKIAASPSRPQFIGLSAVLSEGSRLADWLNCDLLLFRQRPIELREGVLDLTTGQFQYRCANSAEENSEDLISPEFLPLVEPSDPTTPLVSAALYLAEARAEQVIIFVPTRAQSRQLAARIAELSTLASAPTALDELAQHEETTSRNILLECLRTGVAFHNADLSEGIRTLIEAQYTAGEIRLLVSTSTLGQGVNLTGRNVIQIPIMAAQDAWTGDTAMVPLSISRYRNQGGRAGRYSLEQDFGRSILLAVGPDEAQRLYRKYIAGEIESFDAPLSADNLQSPIIDYIASGIAHSPLEIEHLLLRTYTGFSEWSGSNGFAQKIETGISNLTQLQLLSKDERGLQITGLGRTMAIHGLAAATVSRMREFLISLNAHAPSEFATLLVLGTTADGEEFPCPMTFRERRQSEYHAQACELLAAEIDKFPILRQILFPDGGIDASQVVALKKSLILLDWIGADETAEIESRYGVLSGTIANLAAHIHWLLLALEDAAVALGVNRAARERFRALAERLPLGLQENARGLSGLRVQELSRGMAQTLVREGYDSLKALGEADVAALSRILPERVAMSVFKATRPAIKSNGKRPAPTQSADGPTARLRIDEANPGRVQFDGYEIQLPPLPYQLLLSLARKASRIITREALAAQLWPDGAVEDQQVNQHRRAISNAFAPIIGPKEARNLIETRRGVGLRLTLSPAQVIITGN